MGVLYVNIDPLTEAAGAYAQRVANESDTCAVEGVTWTDPDASGKQDVRRCGLPAVGCGVFRHPTDTHGSILRPLCAKHCDIAGRE